MRAGEPDAPSRPGLFATPPLEGAHAGLAIVGGVLSIPIADGTTRAFGYLEARPSIVVHRTVTLDGFIGDALTADGAQILYGGGATINFAPAGRSVRSSASAAAASRSARTPTRSSSRSRTSSSRAPAAASSWRSAAASSSASRSTNMTLFDSDSFKNAQTYSGGFGVYF